MNTRRLVSTGQNTENTGTFSAGPDTGGLAAAGNTPEAAMAKANSRMASVGQETAVGTADMQRVSAAALPEEIQAFSESVETAAADDAPALQAAPEPMMAAAEAGQAVGDSPVYEAAPAAEGDVSVAVRQAVVEVSPLTASKSPAESTLKVSLSCEDYRKKLQDIDSQIQKMKDSGVEPNPDSYKNMADYEYRLWDNEVSGIYQDILSCMTKEDVDALVKEQKEWEKARDAAAHKAISKYNGGTMESLEYTASLADSYRSRAYGLLDSYGEVLQKGTQKE